MAIWNERIKQRRLQAGLTLLEIAENLGVTEATAQRYESGGIKSVPYDYICKYSVIFNCSPSYLMGWESEYLDKETLNASLSEKEKKLLSCYRLLNEKGKEKALENVSDLTFINYYREDIIN